MELLNLVLNNKRHYRHYLMGTAKVRGWMPHDVLILQAAPTVYIAVLEQKHESLRFPEKFRIKLISTLVDIELEKLPDIDMFANIVASAPAQIRNRGFIPWYVSNYFRAEQLERRVSFVEKLILKAGGTLDVEEPALEAA